MQPIKTRQGQQPLAGLTFVLRVAHGDGANAAKLLCVCSGRIQQNQARLNKLQLALARLRRDVNKVRIASQIEPDGQ